MTKLSVDRPIGILGGTFDPIHLGHLRMAIELQQSLSLDHVRIIPCYQPVHRKNPEAPAHQRLKMIEIAVQTEPALRVDACEIERKGPSYTIHTLQFLREKFPHQPLSIIMGIDALLSFTSWYQWESILKLSHLIIAYRPNYQLPQTGIVSELLNTHSVTDRHRLREIEGGNILLHPVTSIDISSTDIRKQISQGRNIRYLVPDSVYDFVKKNAIYSILSG